jgi:hypothetical protein
VTIIYHKCCNESCPAVAQPGRAFGCRRWLNEYKLTTRSSLLGIQRAAVTEESQAQTEQLVGLFWSKSCPRDIPTKWHTI